MQIVKKVFFMAVVASRSAPPAPPPAASIQRCHSRTVRLECPDNLTGTWADPVYATLGREPLSKRPPANTPFVDSDDGAQRLVWEVTHADDPSARPAFRCRTCYATVHFIPHWRLTEPHRDLKDELLERPLLSVFRFVRFSTYFVASPRCNTKFVRVTSDFFG
ncbi:hypothetical protein PR003_g5869 [Phytophthora rubi]|uniref:Uncharacterized protein n=1 Tax=Phytophthora rubi TaxID=129364 RepID=A0A6A4FYI8_9STRA|nr:hypothetical protein PR002_g18419 [Phytophthora rubi]KAE9040141.1 hypothetical protein PR001_g7204 [Phytophthora rubi]KAE9349466.1 hypothetical protein PR003_g5869 [Phytophthora rubi]